MKKAVPGNVLVGTSGYSYQDWKGPFYPTSLPDRDMLTFYARHFPAVEINFTFYRVPTARTMAAIVRKAPRLSYAVKITRDITHEGKLTRELAQSFREGIAPMVDAGVLGCLLVQFPWRVVFNESVRDLLKRLAECFADLRLVAEGRNEAWARDGVYEELRALGVGFCNVDEPRLKGLMPPTAVATSDVGYFRFHGRNAKSWWRHDDAAERYDYLYSREELAEWSDRITAVARQTKRTYVFMNNHPLGKAVTNAAMMMDLLGVAFERGDDGAFF